MLICWCGQNLSRRNFLINFLGKRKHIVFCRHYLHFRSNCWEKKNWQLGSNPSSFWSEMVGCQEIRFNFSLQSYWKEQNEDASLKFYSLSLSLNIVMSRDNVTCHRPPVKLWLQAFNFYLDWWLEMCNF